MSAAGGSGAGAASRRNNTHIVLSRRPGDSPPSKTVAPVPPQAATSARHDLSVIPASCGCYHRPRRLPRRHQHRSELHRPSRRLAPARWRAPARGLAAVPQCCQFRQAHQRVEQDCALQQEDAHPRVVQHTVKANTPCWVTHAPRPPPAAHARQTVNVSPDVVTSAVSDTATCSP